MPSDTSRLYYLYMKAIVDAIFDSNGDEKLAVLRCGAIRSAYTNAVAFSNEGFLSCVIESLFEKKAQFINSASTKHEINEILKPSVPYYDYNSLKPKSIYHVDEEELLIWSKTSLLAPLYDFAAERYRELFMKILPEQAALIGLKK